MVGLFPSWTIPSLPLSFLWLIPSLNLLTISNTPCLHDKHTRLHHHGSPSTSAISSPNHTEVTQTNHKLLSLPLYRGEKEAVGFQQMSQQTTATKPWERSGQCFILPQGLIKETLLHSCSGPYGRICLLLAGRIKFELELTVSTVTSSTWRSFPSVKCESQWELPFATHFTSKMWWILSEKDINEKKCWAGLDFIYWELVKSGRYIPEMNLQVYKKHKFKNVTLFNSE